MIIDQAQIYLKAGNGGEGCNSKLSLYPHKVIGGGGDGGKGADIILKVSAHPYDLSKIKSQKSFIAENGQPGGPANRKGKDADPLIIDVPCGTRVLDLEENVIIDLDSLDQQFIICHGGQPGRGNFKRDFTVPACPGQEREIILDYRTPNDIALAGFANSGRTSLLNKLTGKAFKVADYPFTTQTCLSAKFEYDFETYTVLDTPPLNINKPKDNSFVKHFLRSRVILLLSENPVDFNSDFEALKQQILEVYPGILKHKKLFYLLTKVDKIDSKIKAKGILPISVKTDIGLDKLKEKIAKAINS